MWKQPLPCCGVLCSLVRGFYDFVCDVLVAVCATSISLAVNTNTKRPACTYGSINNRNREDMSPSIKKGLAVVTTATTTGATTLPGHMP